MFLDTLLIETFDGYGDPLQLYLSVVFDQLDRKGVVPGKIGVGSIKGDQGREVGGKALVKVLCVKSPSLDRDLAMGRWVYESDDRKNSGRAILVDARKDADVDVGLWLAGVVAFNR